MMTKRSRTALFLFLGAVFLAGTPALIFYSQGYRFSWEERRFAQAGAFYFNIIPTQAEVLVNEKSLGRTARILGTTLTKSFPPGTYAVRIQKEGYQAWEKRLQVFAKQVTEAKRIVLFPQNPAFTELQENAQAVWFAPNRTEALVQKFSSQGPGNNEEHPWMLWFWDIQRKTEYPLYEAENPQEQLLDARWAQNSQAFLLRVAAQGQTRSFVQRLDRDALANQSVLAKTLETASLLRTPLRFTASHEQSSFSPFSENEIIFLDSSLRLSVFDYAQNTRASPLSLNAIAFFAGGGRILWLDQKGMFWMQENRNANPIALNKEPFTPTENAAYVIREASGEFFIQEGQTLYRLNPQTGIFAEFFAPFQEMKLSPDGKKLALSSGREIWLYFLEEDRAQPRRAKGEKIFLTRFGENIAGVDWITSSYLVFARADAVVITEIDDRDRINGAELASFFNPILLWQDATNTLLVHTENKVLVSAKLLP